MVLTQIHDFFRWANVLKPKIDMNSDLGESYGVFRVGNDAEIMPHITSANVACGYHAGDPNLTEEPQMAVHS